MLIYLNGTSSSGKTAIATELQKLIAPTFYFSIDTILYALAEDLEAIKGKRPYRSPLNWNSIFDGYFACVAGLLDTGNRVIADCPIHTLQLASSFAKYLGQTAKTVVKVDCSLDELERRENNRGDRAAGVAKRQFAQIHKHLQYDLEIDTEKASPETSARMIASYLDSRASGD